MQVCQLAKTAIDPSYCSLDRRKTPGHRMHEYYCEKELYYTTFPGRRKSTEFFPDLF